MTELLVSSSAQPVHDRVLWTQITMAFRLTNLESPIRASVIKAVACRLALSADAYGEGDYPDPALLASEFEVSIFDAIGALVALRRTGLLRWGPNCGLDGTDEVPARRYQLTIDDSRLHGPDFRDVAGVMSDAQAAGVAFVKLFDDPDPDPLEGCLLYRWFDKDDRLLYVGTTNDLGARTAAHGKKSSWTAFSVRSTVEHFPSREDAQRAEVTAIRTEFPLFNSQYNDTPEARQRLVTYLLEHNRPDLLRPAVSRG